MQCGQGEGLRRDGKQNAFRYGALWVPGRNVPGEVTTELVGEDLFFLQTLHGNLFGVTTGLHRVASHQRKKTLGFFSWFVASSTCLWPTHRLTWRTISTQPKTRIYLWPAVWLPRYCTKRELSKGTPPMPREVRLISLLLVFPQILTQTTYITIQHLPIAMLLEYLAVVPRDEDFTVDMALLGQTEGRRGEPWCFCGTKSCGVWELVSQKKSHDFDLKFHSTHVHHFFQNPLVWSSLGQLPLTYWIVIRHLRIVAG